MERKLLAPEGFVSVPASLLHGAFPDLGVVVGALVRFSFGSQAMETSYTELAERLGLADLSAGAVEQRLGSALRPLLGSWILRTSLGRRRFAYRAVCATRSRDRAIIRVRDLLRLRVDDESSMDVSDIVDFARWQLECGRRGWTAEALRPIAGRWKASPTTVSRSKYRLAQLGLIAVEHRVGASDLVWLRDVLDPGSPPASTPPTARERDDRQAESLKRRPTPRVAARRGTRLYEFLTTLSLPEVEIPVAQVAELIDSPLPRVAWTSASWWSIRSELGRVSYRAGRLAEFDRRAGIVRFISTSADSSRLQQLRQQRRVGKRHAAITLLTSPSSSQQRPPGWARQHEVYELHFPDEQRFKVGLTHLHGHRVERFRRHRAVEVERVTVPNRALAENVEADVLLAVEPWHRLGEPDRPGGGYTEMWSDAGPTVDLLAMLVAAEELVDRVLDMCGAQ